MTAIALPFDLLHLIKEAQLQHGLRTADYSRYHKYLSNRLSTVRKQLNFKSTEGAGKKGQPAKFIKKTVTPSMLLGTVPVTFSTLEPSIAAASFSLEAVVGAASASGATAAAAAAAKAACGGGRYLELLVLLAERCVASYEESARKVEASNDGNATNNTNSNNNNNNKDGGVGAPSTPTCPLVDARKRLNKAAKWAEELFAVASGVYPLPSSPSDKSKDDAGAVQCDSVDAAAALAVVFSCQGYMYELRGRSDTVHVGRANNAENDEETNEDDDGTANFQKAREAYRKAAEAINVMLKIAAAAVSGPTAGGASASAAASVAAGTSLNSINLEQSFNLLIAKIAELDDRVVFTLAAASPADGMIRYKPTPAPTLLTRDGAGAVAASAAATTKKKNNSNTNSANNNNNNASSLSSLLPSQAAPALPAVTTSFLTPHSTVLWMVPSQRSKTADDVDEIPVFNIKVKEFLREAAAVGAPEAMAAVVGASTVTGVRTSKCEGEGSSSSSSPPPLCPQTVTTDHIINVGQQLRIVDFYDRAIGFLNEALTHARSDLRNVQGDARRRQVQRLTLYLQYQISRFTADRTLFVIECLSRRYWFHINRQTIGGSGASNSTNTVAASASSSASPSAGPNGGASSSSSSAPAAVNASAAKYARKRLLGLSSKVPTASPLEIIRLYTTAQDVLTDAYQTPGLEGSEEWSPCAALLARQIEVCRVGRLLFAGEAWLVTKKVASAMSGLTAAKRHISYVTSAHAAEHSKALALTTRAATIIVANNNATSSSSSSSSSSVLYTDASFDVSSLLPVALSADFMKDRVGISLVVATVELNLGPYREGKRLREELAVERADEDAEAYKEKENAKEEDGEGRAPFSAGQRSEESIAASHLIQNLMATRYLIDNLDSQESFAATVQPKQQQQQQAQTKQEKDNATKSAATTNSAKKKAPTAAVTTANLVPFPPSYVPVAPKPIFVDIAATYVDYGDFKAASAAAAAVAAKRKAAAAASAASPNKASVNKPQFRTDPSSAPSSADETSDKKKAGGGWLGGWGWGGKK